MSFLDYLATAGYGLQYAEPLANGRVGYKLAGLFEEVPASRFYGVP